MSMNGIHIAVTGNIAKVTERPVKITTGTVGLPVEFTFDSQWDGLRKMAVFQAGSTARVVDEPTPEAVVPWEVLTEAGVWLCVGVYGINEDGTVVIPTVWASIGVIEQGATPSSDPAADPTLPIWQEIMNEVKKRPDPYAPIYCTATPETLASVISNAEPNTTIELLGGEYGKIILKGNKSYPENLTIRGGNGAAVAGVQISSGLSQAYYFRKLDISESIMPKGLTFVNVYFTGDVALRNCGLEGLTIQSCYFGYGAAISICPNDLEFGVSGQRYDNALVRVKDITIRSNTITNAANTQENAILVLEADGAKIIDNSIQHAAYCGIQVSGRGGVRTTTGQIDIGNNLIKDTGSRSIRLSNLQDAQVVLLYNQMYNANAAECIKISDSSYITVLEKNNLYNDGYISQGNGYTLEEYVPVATDHKHASDAAADFIEEQALTGTVRYRKWASGFAEIWISKVPYGLAENDGNITLALPMALLRDDSPELSPQCQVTIHPSACEEYVILKSIALNRFQNTMCNAIGLTFKPVGDTLPGMVEVFAYITGRWK